MQLALKKILEAVYEPRFLKCMYGFRPRRGCHEAVKEVYQRTSHGKINFIVDAGLYVSADSKDFLHETSKKFPKNPDKYLIFIMKSGIISIVEIK